nr:putative reverse transcriptase domain-containing protein [Tanacetum cinerariifolium]
TDDDSFSLDNIDYVEASPLDSKLVSSEEFAGELTLLKSIPPGIDESDCDFEEDIRLIEKLLYDNSSLRPPKEFVSANSDAESESFSPSPILVKDSDSLMEEIDLFCTPDYPMPPSIVDQDYDSERDILIPKDFPSNNSLSFAKKEKCTSPILWAKIRESMLIGSELVQETTDKVVLIKEKLKAVRDSQKSYADNRRKLLEFEVGDQVLLKVSPWKGVIRFGKKGKLAPRYVGPFEILKIVDLVAYLLRLPKKLSSVHDTFHVSNLKKCLADANLHVPLDEIKVDKTLHFVEKPVEIMDREFKSLKRSNILIVKVR